MLHINCLKVEAVFNFETSSVSSSEQISFGQMRIQLWYKYQQTVGRKFPRLCYQTWYLWKWAIDHNVCLKAAYIAGKINILADHLSRVHIQQTE